MFPDDWGWLDGRAPRSSCLTILAHLSIEGQGSHHHIMAARHWCETNWNRFIWNQNSRHLVILFILSYFDWLDNNYFPTLVTVEMQESSLVKVNMKKIKKLYAVVDAYQHNVVTYGTIGETRGTDPTPQGIVPLLGPTTGKRQGQKSFMVKWNDNNLLGASICLIYMLPNCVLPGFVPGHHTNDLGRTYDVQLSIDNPLNLSTAFFKATQIKRDESDFLHSFTKVLYHQNLF